MKPLSELLHAGEVKGFFTVSGLKTKDLQSNNWLYLCEK